MNFVKSFVEDMKYYDPQKKELKTIISNANLNDKTIVDIGAGSGRLSFPLSNIAKIVIAIESDGRLLNYLRKNKKRNIEIINEKAENYIKNKKFDVILLAWPTIDFKWIKLVNEAMHEDSLFIFTTCDSHSDFETIIDKIKAVKKDYFEEDIRNKNNFIKQLPTKFKLIKKKSIKTTVNFPNKNIAFYIIKNSLSLWFHVKLNKESENNLKKLISNHQKGKRVLFKENVLFYLLEKKL